MTDVYGFTLIYCVMNILAPIDGSECSFRALRFAAQFATRYGASLDVVHFVDQDIDKEREETRELIERAETILAEEGIPDEPEVVTDVWITDYRYANRIGKDILEMADEDYDHIVMGHHGMGTIGRVVLGSAAETVVRAAKVSVTVIP